MVTRNTMIDKDSPMPLWAQVLADLRLRIERGEFRERFPTDAELMDSYGVSRHTVREAARRLQSEGVIDRGRGVGTFVRPQVIEQPLGALYSLFRSVEESGYTQRSVVRHLEERADTEAAKTLGRPADEPLVYLERLRMADEDPVFLDCSWLPAAIARPLLDVDFAHTALYRELGERCGTHPDAGWERLAPAIPTLEQRSLLGLRAGVPVLAIERLASARGVPVEWRHGLVRADRFSYVARWSGRASDAGFEPR
ncbi:MAG TPA: GntR family transcriptional regulator [Trebonia sp.]|jgi:GntR family transcriptional regulator